MKRLALALAFASGTAVAHDQPMDLSQFMRAFGWDFEATEVTSQTVADGLHVLFGIGGNIGVSIGDDGVLIVDDQFPQMMPKILKKIGELGGGDVDFAINTHWHFDHAEGNLALGPAGTWIVAHTNSREMMLDSQIIDLVMMKYKQQAYPEDALPHITFDDRMAFHFNGELIEVVHPGPAHTAGDAAVIFRGSNAVHFGDVFNNTGYPFVDAGNGGDLTGMIAFCSAVRDAIDEKTIVIPGHGEVTDYATLTAYIAMLETVKGRIVELLDDGATFGEVVAANVTAEFDEAQGDSTNFVNRAYVSLKRERGEE